MRELAFFRGYGFDGGRKLRMGRRINRSVLDLSACRVLAEEVVAFPIVRRSDGSGYKTTAAIRADVIQNPIDTSGAKCTFISTDACLK